MEIRLENLTKVFTDKKSGTETRAVDDLNLTIPDGKLVGLLGPSGCGKSTTLYMIAGLHDPTGGKIFFGEDDVTELAPEKRGIGLVFQNYALYPHMTVKQNIMFPLQNLKGEQKMSKEDMLKVTIEMAQLVGIEDQLAKRPAQLSGGQQQRVAIARALVKKPRVLLLDEPLSNLDARLRLQTREEIRRIQRETGITTIFVTHDQEEAMSISDEIVLMEKGVKKQVGAPQDVYENPGNLFVGKFLGTPPINVFKGIIKGKKVIVGEETLFSSAKLNGKDQEVFVAIRPEGYDIDQAGTFTINYEFIEKIGRDMVLVCNHSENEKKSFRIILDDDAKITPNSVKLKVNESKCFLFDRITGERIL